MNPTNPNAKATMSNHALILAVVKYPGKPAEALADYASNMAYLVGGEVIHTPCESVPDAVYVQNRERGLAGPVVLCTYRDGQYHSFPPRKMEQVMARLDAGQW